MGIGTEARPLSGSRLNKDVNVGGIGGLLGGFSLQAVKKSGPSPGIGHKYEDFQTQGEATRSGPSSVKCIASTSGCAAAWVWMARTRADATEI
ncbi:hypothetical protein POTOM_033178 [Populus tomentosa]|uniref:Uncharacterized protein n=1 Tax=Populus tomentosa TaxID=118781 RepID=A0A8X8CR58_POPTO|nr:hypothetical protein POTOM_033178 [Populus tomentosa]